jgi:hypothetical protein
MCVSLFYYYLTEAREWMTNLHQKIKARLDSAESNSPDIYTGRKIVKECVLTLFGKQNTNRLHIEHIILINCTDWNEPGKRMNFLRTQLVRKMTNDSDAQCPNVPSSLWPLSLCKSTSD